jgi:rubredoxin
MAETRVPLPGGWMTTQELRDLVGWAGAAGAQFLTAGDRQDWIVDGAAGRLPGRLTVSATGSLQSTAYGNAPAAAHPWLTTGVWMDLLGQIPLPEGLDVQLLHEGARAHFIRWGHIRLTAQRAPHRWSVALRRPGAVRLTVPETVVETGGIPALVAAAGEAWATGDETFWRGAPLSETPPQALFSREGFHDETAGTFAWGLWSPRFRLEHLRDVAWLASESGAHRVWLTPDRVLLVPGIPRKHRPAWEEWLARTRLPSTHGDIARSVRAAGAMGPDREVAARLHADDRVPPGGAVIVADDALNRGDGVCGPFATLIRASNWLFRTADGHQSGEGTLDEVLRALDRPPRAESVPLPVPEVHRCTACLTVYEPALGDPRGGVPRETPFESLPESWECPVCGAPRSNYAAPA